MARTTSTFPTSGMSHGENGYGEENARGIHGWGSDGKPLRVRDLPMPVIGKPLIGYAEKGAKPRPKPTPVAKVNAERKGHRAAENVNEPLRAWIRQQPCLLTGLVNASGDTHRCVGPVQACHVKPWGSSLTDEENLVPLCYGAHLQQEGKTKQFEMAWPVRLARPARKFCALFYKALGLAAAAKKKASRETSVPKGVK